MPNWTDENGVSHFKCAACTGYRDVPHGSNTLPGGKKPLPTVDEMAQEISDRLSDLDDSTIKAMGVALRGGT